MIFKVTNIAMSLVFLLAAGVQYNDPDPIRWISIYGLAATACFLSLARQARRLPRALAAVLGACGILGGFFLALRVVGKQSVANSEEGREMLGLFLVALWMAALLIWTRKQRHKEAG
ncbi:transmembrane 220 family protein [Acidobacteria bacterium AH-259-L09]|nr:transmembrane 220 family protein [Acidobacteria bacterium AH-259-L09]